MDLLKKFRLANEKEDYDNVSINIRNGIDFKGTNLWILIFAIFIASLGLNVNSTAVIIGAMLVSPLMGPIMGLGFGMAINDLELLKKSLHSYFFAAGVGLATSTVFFLLSPINEAHSEILARTAPTIYDVLIALFGGLAGILATSSKLKGNVIPGVAIATALMPPLCTAGYGLATLQFQYFFGAFYLFFINTVFIALATLITIRFLKFPYKQMLKKEDGVKAKRIVWVVVIVTVLPSLYFGYDLVQQNKFEKMANKFIEVEAVFPNDYLLRKHIDSKNQTISLTYGGEIISKTEIDKLKSKLINYNLENIQLEIRQGFAYLNDDVQDKQSNQLTVALDEKDNELRLLHAKLDSISSQNVLGNQIFKEIKALHPTIESFSFQKSKLYTDTVQQAVWIGIVNSRTKFDKKNKSEIEDWLRVRINTENIKIYFE